MDGDLPKRSKYSGDFSERIAGLSPAKRALLERRLEKNKGDAVRKATILPRQGSENPPLSFAQQRLWFLNKYEPNSHAYNISKVFQLKGAVNVTALKKALKTIVDRHEVLRTTFDSIDGKPVQVIQENHSVELPIIDISNVSLDDKDTEVQALLSDEVQKTFDFSSDVMLRSALIKLNSDEHLLLIVIHHIASDGWSMGIFWQELSALYNAYCVGNPSPLPDLPIQYADFAVWQRERLQGEEMENQLSYWKTCLKGAPGILELPTDHPRPSIQTYRGAQESFSLPRDLTSSLTDLCKLERVTLFMILLSVFKVLLYRYTDQEDMLVGTPIANRNQNEIEGLIGFFVNTLVLRTGLSGNSTFRDLLKKVRNVCLDAYAHQDVPFERLVEELQPQRDMSHSPFVQVMFAFQNVPKGDLMLSGLTVSEMELKSGAVRFDLEFFMWEKQGKLRGSFVYNADLFNADTIERMGRHFQMLLEGIVANPQQRISDLPLLAKVEKHQLQVEWNETNTTYPQDLCIHQLFDIQSEKTPDAVAVEFGEDRLSYSELNRQSNQLAHYLRSKGVGPDVLVGICVERSLDMVIGLLGILKAGGAYVPLDPSYPQERLAYMLEETRTPVLLTQKQLLPRLPNQKGKIFCLDSDWESIAHLSKTSPSFKMTPDNLAYVIYTSGSTGRPKGTCVPHRAITRLVLNTNYISLTPSDRIAQASNSSFDAATFEIWGALLNGACLVGMTTDELLSPQEFAVKIRDKKITTLFLTTALFNQLAAYAPQAFSSLKHLLFGGEAVDPKWVREVLKHGAPHRLVHVYGPTENTTFSTWHLVENVAADDTTIPIGRPISNTQCYVFDKHMQVVPVGIPGELCLGGDGLARGYFNQPELTKERFVPNPFSEAPGGNLYKTGDLVRYLPDGNIEFLGRIDDQVKLRGFRIELSEIEAVMSQHGHIDNVAVMMREDRPGDKKLVAYFIPKKDLEYDMSDLRVFLSKKLPEYMIPRHFVALEEFPITANGKINRKALPAPLVTDLSREQGFVEPRTAIEAKLTEIWQELIGINRISINDNFFEIGGHSLLAVQLFSKLTRLFGIDLPLATLFESPTIEGLARRVEEFKKTNRIKRIFEIFRRIPTLDITATDKGSYTHLVAIQPNGNRPPFFCMHAVGGNVLQYYSFVDELGSDQPLYGLQSRGLDGMSEPYKDIETMAVNYIKEMRQLQPHGPYFVGGGSMGGLIALEVAQQLKQDGEEIALLTMFDTFAPSHFDPEAYKPRKLFSKNWVKNFLPNHIQELRKQSLKGQVVYGYNRISGLIRHRFKFFICFFYHRIRRPLPHSVRYWYVENKNRRPAFVYTPKTYDGNLTLFSDSRNAGVEEKDMEKGWGEFISGEIEVVGIPAEHFEFIEEPILARKLKICLDKVQKNMK